ncbi:contact-dependent growth inhibition system immunity protein [Paludibacterium yongneupense]|uniref:contact-dependent growth inhibition system immunity protein n=1 Tax=Paludibacterium yongneupense TaxID=400061 RepID=UPI0006852B49|nr:contact-dependent growth inhibition system immunity protein [Paludibacterium yongneupense]
MTNEITRGYWVGVHCNGDFVCMETYSGYRSTRCDSKGKQHLLTPDVSDETLGLAVNDAMDHSRFVLPARRDDVWQHPDAEFDLSLYDYKQIEVEYVAWVKSLMERYSYKTQKSLFKDMKNVSIEKKSGLITFKPTHHEKLEDWSGTGEDVVIPDTSTAIEVGAALRLALSRCTG